MRTKKNAMRKLILFLLLAVLTQLSFGQNVRRSVISSFGAKGNAVNGVTLRSTVAQPPNAGTISNSQNILRQGFQQPQPLLCEDAPQALFTIDSTRSGNCGWAYRFNYLDIPEDDTQFAWTFGPDGIPDTSSQENPVGITFDTSGQKEITLMVTTEDCFYDTTYVFEYIKPTFSVDINVTDVDCFGNETGIIEPTVIGGLFPFSFDWSNGSENTVLVSLASGDYGYTIVDNDSCVVDGVVSIMEPDTLDGFFFTEGTSCASDADGSIDVTILGGTEPYLYEWSNGKMTEDLDSLAIGNYLLEVTDDLGCTLFLDVPIESACLTLDFKNLFSPNGDGSNEVWEITNIDQYPSNYLEIYNRWGSLVYTQEGYDNSWTGVDQEGQLLPVGAYYYIMKLNDEEETTHTGSVTILR